jgi:hypothetical protein
MSANAAWAAYTVHQNPTFFDELASKQAPSIREFTFPQPAFISIKALIFCL